MMNYIVLYLFAAMLPSEAFLIHNRNSIRIQRGVSQAVAASRGKRRNALVVSAASSNEDEEVDVVVIGSGVGGLSPASLLAQYGKQVLVLEAHEHPGISCVMYSTEV